MGETGQTNAGQVTLFLCGDVMTGRGIDQVLPHPCDPRLCESHIKSATRYVELAEARNGPIPMPIAYADVWGEALAELDHRQPNIRIINLETAVTHSDHPAPKEVNYRMSPENIPCITAAGVDCCVLANNHVLDWGNSGLLETMETLRRAGITITGAGRDVREATMPAVPRVSEKGRVIVFAFGVGSSGVPRAWAAGKNKLGVNFLPDLSGATVNLIAGQVEASKQRGDVVVASLHWGPNWGYQIPSHQRTFAHRLIESAGVDLVFGHSSHHPKGIEVYRRKLILYGCGDFLNDYEGIRGYEAFRDDLVLMYFPTVDAHDGTLLRLAMVPFRIRNFRLRRTSAAEANWLQSTLDREGQKLGTRVRVRTENEFDLEWA